MKMQQSRHLAAFLPLLLLVAVGPLPVLSVLSCPVIGETFANQNPRLDTIDPIKRVSDTSGLVFSQSQVGPRSGAPILFGLGDKGDGNRIFVWDSSTGERLMTLTFDERIIQNEDWEDISLGSCGLPLQFEDPGLPQSQYSCLYVGDFGSNTAGDSGGRRDGRNGVLPRIIKIVEPRLEDFQDQEIIPTSYYSILEFDYRHPTSPTAYANCETMFLDHAGWGSTDGNKIGDIYLVTKWGGNDANPNADMFRKTRLFHIPTSAWPSSSNCADIIQYSPEAVGDYNSTLNLVETPSIIGMDEEENQVDEEYYEVTGGQLFGHEWRSGDMSFDGTLIGLGTRENAFMFLRW